MNHFEFGFFDEFQKLANPGDLKVNMGVPQPKPTVTAGPNLGPGVSPNLNTTMGRLTGNLPKLRDLSGPSAAAPQSDDYLRHIMHMKSRYARNTGDLA